MKEIWKDIKGYEGYYQVSNMGRIKSYKRLHKFKTHQRYYGGKILTPIKLPKSDSYAHYAVNLSKNNKHKTFIIHRIVAKHFIDNPKNKQCVNHIDFDTSNNSVDNLEWCTQKENMQHSLKHGNLNQLLYGKEKEVFKLYDLGFTTIEIGEYYNVSKKVVLYLLKKNGLNRKFYETRNLKSKRNKQLTIDNVVNQ